MIKITLVSLNQIWEDKEANKIRCKDFIQKASRNQSDLVVFPEMTLTGFSMNTEYTAEEIENSETIKWFRNQAIENSICIIYGLVIKSPPKAKNILIFIDKRGGILAEYAKIHPFSYSGEDKYFLGGNELKYSTFNRIDIGVSICYDLRFPEMFQGLSKNCEIIVNISNWPKRRADHWTTLLKARAIENQVFMIGVNRTGIDGNNIKYKKSSAIFGPDGKIINPILTSKELDTYYLNINDVRKIRNNFPVKKDRKIVFYKDII